MRHILVLRPFLKRSPYVRLAFDRSVRYSTTPVGNLENNVKETKLVSNDILQELETSDDKIKDVLANKKVSDIANLKYFTNPQTGSIKIISESIKTEDDLRHAYDEFISLIKNAEMKNKIKCKSCGISPLQSNDENAKNYYKIPKIPTHRNNVKKTSNIDAEMALLKEMGFGKDSSDVFTEKEVLLEQRVKQLAETCDLKVDCLRCHQLKTHGIYDIDGFEIADIMNQIPSNGTIVNVISIFDFPLSCDTEILKGRDPKEIWYVVTKADLFYRQEVQLNRTGLSYIQDTLEKYMGADPSKVFFVSTTKTWNNKQLISRLPSGKLYFVGRANVGKSSLIKSLIASTFGVDTQNKLAQKMEKKNINYLEKLGINAPGTYHIPGFTRSFQKFKFNDRFTIFDTPGFFPKGLGMYKYMTEELIRKKLKYPLFVAEDRRRFVKLDIKGPKIFNGDSLYSYGGFFYLNPPKGAILKRCISFNKGEKTFEARYSRFVRAKELNETRPKQIGNRYGVTNNTFDSLKRYVIPPFYGTVDIVIQDLGFISIMPTSSPNSVDGLFQIWVPEGVRVIVRESIFNFMYKTHDKVDETGNRLNKENISKRGATRLRSILDEDKLHFTELIPVAENISNEEAFAMVCPPEDMNINRDSKGSQEEYRNQYWKKLNI